MHTSSPVYSAGSWLAIMAICASITYAGGFFVATDRAMSQLKEREATWEAQARASRSREDKLSRELAVLNVKLTDKDEEMTNLRKKVESLTTDLQRVTTTAQKDKDDKEAEISLLEEALTSKAERAAQLYREVARRTAMAVDSFDLQSPLSIEQVVTAKNAFHDIQHEVAAGNFKGLALTNGYQRLKTIFENPDLEGLSAGYDAVKEGAR
ncbi:hypothetical protein [Roseimicrobium sp. ORNL1]|uniref:hypothetical protein n=1 Tax=Roseimicrobium sp. ORNL1 TaxID=2711231 RepID=UPI0013E129BF|nr:hypothetical protein [Roseimicrobium sp. ORNL1]QIF01710.1 hypothetical protein G5S37_09295 [Roseimicrobium sp. ORNL1]